MESHSSKSMSFSRQQNKQKVIPGQQNKQATLGSQQNNQKIVTLFDPKQLQQISAEIKMLHRKTNVIDQSLKQSSSVISLYQKALLLQVQKNKKADQVMFQELLKLMHNLLAYEQRNFPAQLVHSEEQKNKSHSIQLGKLKIKRKLFEIQSIELDFIKEKCRAFQTSVTLKKDRLASKRDHLMNLIASIQSDTEKLQLSLTRLKNQQKDLIEQKKKHNNILQEMKASVKYLQYRKRNWKY